MTHHNQQDPCSISLHYQLHVDQLQITEPAYVCLTSKTQDMTIVAATTFLSDFW